MSLKDGKKLLIPGKWYAEFDKDGNVENVIYDNSFRKLLGYENEKDFANGEESWENSLHPDDKKRVVAHFADITAKHPEGMDYDIEYRMKTKKGYHWFHDYGDCERSEDGTLLRCHGIIFDIQDTMNKYTSLAKHEAVWENNERVLALEDRFESLYDVDVETGHYEVYIKGKTFGDVNSKLTNNNDFFEDAKKNIEKVIHPKDKENVSKIMTRENICGVLEKEPHFDWYYRMMVHEKPIWLRMRIIYKNAKKRHIIVGVFNADDELHTQQLVKFKALAEAVGSAFSSMYSINLNKNTFQIFKPQENSDIYPRIINETQTYTEAVGKWIDAKVSPEDQQKIRDIVKPDNIRKAFDERNIIETRYRANISSEWRYYDLQLIRSSDFEHTSEFTLAVIDCNNDVQLEEEQAKAALRTKIIEQMSGNEGVFLINCEKNVRTTIQNHLNGSLEYSDDEKYSEAFRRYVTKYVAEDDRREMLKYSSPAYILESLKEKNDNTITYKDMTSGVQHFYAMRLVKFSDTEVLQSFSKKDKEIVDSLIYNKLKDNYFAFFTIDIDAGIIRVQKENFGYLMGEEGIAKSYSEVFKDFAKTYTGETKDFFEKISNLDYIKTKFAKEDKSTYTFKSRKINGALWINVTGLVLTRHEDGTPSLFALGFNFADTQESNAKEIQEQIKEDMEMIGGLASEYHTLYYFNINEHFFKVYSLDGQKFPEAKMYVANDKDPLEMLRQFGQSDVIHPDDREQFMLITVENIREKLSHSKKYSIRFRQIINGDFLWVEMDIVKYEEIDIPANAIAIGFAVRDKEIRREREREQEKELANQQRHIKSFGDMVNAALWSFEIDENNNVGGIKWTDEFRNMVGYRSETEFPNTFESWEKILHPDDKERALKTLWNSVNTKDIEKASYEISYRLLRKTGEYCWYHAVGRMEITGDNTRRMYGVIKDISADKKLEEQLMLSDGLAREYHTVWIIEGQGNHKMHLYRSTGNKTIQSAVQLGLTENCYDTGVVKYIMKSVHVDDRERVLKAANFETIVKETPDVGTYVISYKRYYDDNDKSKIDYHQMCFAKAVADNGTVNYIFAFRDADKMLREQIMQQRQLQTALAMAQSANKSKSNFLFNMSHDIRTPINAITGFTTMAKKFVENKDKMNEYLDKIDISGQQLLMLINQVLEMSRIESGKIEFDEKPINIRKNNESLVTVLSEQAKAAGLEFHHTLSDITHYNVIADEARMSQITLNIAGNAIKYTPKGGRIDILFKENEKHKEGYASFTLTVIDTGIGMSEDFQKVIFEPFSREKSSTVSKIQGTGLGMSIVKNLVDMLGGTIEVHSELGKGSRFDVTVEFKINEKKNKNKDFPQVTNCARFKGRKVLLVEDNEFNREIAKFILEENGLKVDEAEDGDIAVQKIKNLYEKGDYKHYDFILMDIQMPRMNGFEATAKIREIPTPEGVHIPIIAITANAFEEDKQNAMAAGMDAHLAKPIDIQMLQTTLEKFIA